MDITTLGIDVSKNSFHVIGANRAGKTGVSTEVHTPEAHRVHCQSSALPHWHGGLPGLSALCSQVRGTWPSGQTDAGAVRKTLRQVEQKRLQ